MKHLRVVSYTTGGKECSPPDPVPTCSPHMKTPFAIILLTATSAVTLPAAVTITANVHIPNGSESGGSSSNAGDLSIDVPGTIVASTTGGVVDLPVTTYSVSGVDLSSVGGSNNESFTFTVSYTATSDGTTTATPTFSGFGNVGVDTGGTVSGSETLNATVSLVSSSFSNLSLTGFVYARAGGASPGETGTLSWTGGSFAVSNGNTITTDVSGDSFMLTAGSASTLNIEGFRVEFVAVPEPASASLLFLGAAALLRRRRRA